MTVRELIARLSEEDTDAEVQIEDADTDWWLPIQKVRCENDIVLLRAEYY